VVQEPYFFPPYSNGKKQKFPSSVSSVLQTGQQHEKRVFKEIVETIVSMCSEDDVICDLVERKNTADSTS